jgi:hypothetical protein
LPLLLPLLVVVVIVVVAAAFAAGEQLSDNHERLAYRLMGQPNAQVTSFNCWLAVHALERC